MKPSEKELVSVRIPKELNKKLAEHVSAMGISKAAFILNLINKELKKSAALERYAYTKDDEPVKAAV